MPEEMVNQTEEMEQNVNTDGGKFSPKIRDIFCNIFICCDVCGRMRDFFGSF